MFVTLEVRRLVGMSEETAGIMLPTVVAPTEMFRPALAFALAVMQPDSLRLLLPNALRRREDGCVPSVHKLALTVNAGVASTGSTVKRLSLYHGISETLTAPPHAVGDADAAWSIVKGLLVKVVVNELNVLMVGRRAT